MQIVGDKLQAIAIDEANDQNKDLYGRSAFNRYYYATYLVTRGMLDQLDSKWKNTKHKNIPPLLTTAVYDVANRALKKANRKDLITIGQYSDSVRTLKAATTGLSDLLKQAYDVRSIADYEPESYTIVKNNIIVLEHHKLTTAKKWSGKASGFCKSIIKVWKDAGLV